MKHLCGVRNELRPKLDLATDMRTALTQETDRLPLTDLLLPILLRAFFYAFRSKIKLEVFKFWSF
jgi:hypothetical protein